jgi:hypothetical protein
MKKETKKSVSISSLDNSNQQADDSLLGYKQVAKYLNRIANTNVRYGADIESKRLAFIANLSDNEIRDFVWAYISELRNSHFDEVRKRWEDWILASTDDRNWMIKSARREVANILLS